MNTFTHDSRNLIVSGRLWAAGARTGLQLSRQKQFVVYSQLEKPKMEIRPI